MLALNLIIAANLILFFMLFFFRKNNVLPNKILAFILLDPAINFISNATILTNHFYDFPYVYFLAQATGFLFAPLVHVYVTLLINQKVRWKHPLYIVTGISILLIGYYALEFSQMTPDNQRIYLDGILHEPYPVQMVIISFIFILLQQTYFTVSAIQIYRYRKSLSQVLSNYDKTRVRYITTFIVLIWILNLFTFALYALLPTVQVEYIYLPAVLIIIYFVIMYFGVHYHSIFTKETYHAFVSENNLTELLVVPPIEKGTTEPENGNQLIIKKIEDYLTKEEPFINPHLTLEMLAQFTGISPGKISTVINTTLKKTFYDLINEKRVEKAKQLLQSKPDYTIEAIAYESGFNSRASFYRAFKKYTGKNPSYFIRK